VAGTNYNYVTMQSSKACVACAFVFACLRASKPSVDKASGQTISM